MPTPEPAVEVPPEIVEPEETVDGIPVLAAEVRALEPVVSRRQLPAVQAAAVAATSFVAGAAAVVAIHRHAARKPAGVRRRRKRGDSSETLSVVGTRSFLLDVHLLGRE
ncbi:MAG TPA: hypothetical protein VK506_15480 [Conexibacter sp.]|nr:hypothetical protein [Conexibacter sp.]